MAALLSLARGVPIGVWLHHAAPLEVKVHGNLPPLVTASLSAAARSVSDEAPLRYQFLRRIHLSIQPSLSFKGKAVRNWYLTADRANQ